MPAIDDPRNARSRRTRAALLTAAREQIEADGMAGLTMASVADRAGVSRRAVYLHFRSRTELVTALFGHINEAEDLSGSVLPVQEAPDAATALREWAHHLARYHPRMFAVGRALQQAQHTDPDAAAHWRLVMRDWRAYCRKLTARLADDGHLAPPWTVDTAADMLWALMSFDVLEGLVTQRRWSRRQLADRLAALFHATFVAKPEPADRS